MGIRGLKIRAAIAHLANDGCDLTDPSLNSRLRAEDARFYLGYLEEDCGFRLTADEVVAVARAMMRELGRAGDAKAGVATAALLMHAPPQHSYN